MSPYGRHITRSTAETYPRYASLVDAGTYTRTSKDSIRRMIERREVRQYRIGHLVRVDLNELDRAMARNAGWMA